MPSLVPEIRVRAVNRGEIDPKGSFVLYWMIATRRTHDNYALDRAIEHCKRLDLPLVVLEALRVGYLYASDRFHRFVIDGMADNAESFARAGVAYHPYVEPEAGHGSGLLQAFAKDAAVVVTDDFPCFFLPRMVHAAGEKLGVLLEAVDSNGVMPIRAHPKACFRAFDFRRFVQKNFAEHYAHLPSPAPLSRLSLPKHAIPTQIRERWPAATKALLEGKPHALAALPIDHGVPVVSYRGGSSAAQKTLASFLSKKLDAYDEARNHPDKHATSGLSPYLHFGQISPHRIFAEIAEREDWTVEALDKKPRGERNGFWKMHPSAEAFIDQLLVWREVGLNFNAHNREYMTFASLPDWSKKTLTKHKTDVREKTYSRAELDQAQSYDPLWNAAQRELVREGRIHNYMRMLWGKKILEWSKTPEHALATAIHLNDRYAVDGRDPNSYSGILWCFGRYDRAWGPERPIFGTIRFMSSDSAGKKLWLEQYLERYSEEPSRSSAK